MSLLALLQTTCTSKPKEQQTIIEFSPDIPPPTFMGGATCGYGPTETEEPFYRRLDDSWCSTVQSRPNEKDAERSAFLLEGHVGEYVSWWGVVRRIDKSSNNAGGSLIIENKYFDEITDCNFQSISISGAGDFEAELSRIPEDIIPLVLVRVYGRVTHENSLRPVIKADYVRVWHFGQFAFFDYGEDRGNPEWKKNVERHSHENPYIEARKAGYYRSHLGPTPEQLQQLRKYYGRDSIIHFADIPFQTDSRNQCYEPTSTERSFFDELPDEGRITLESKPNESVRSRFKLRGHVGQFVSWFGIVRKIEFNPGERPAKLSIENKYFQDCRGEHPQTVSINGGGNFTAELTHIAEGLPLTLVRAYGYIIGEGGAEPIMRVDYMRVWRWGEFAFSDYGQDQSHPGWKLRRTLKSGEQVFQPKVSAEYYIRRLGPTKPQAKHIVEWFRWLDAQDEAENTIPVETVEENR